MVTDERVSQIKEVLETAVKQDLSPDVLKVQGLRAIDEFKKNLSPCVSLPSFENLKQYIDILRKSKRQKSLIVYGENGIGKSSFMTDYLKTDDYAYLNNYTTALAFYEFAYHNKENIIVLDDCDSLLNDLKGISLLKALTDTKEALVSYESTTSKMSVPSNFIFKGKIIILTNDLPALNRLRSLLDRAIVREIVLSNEEKKEFAKDVIYANYPTLQPESLTEIHQLICDYVTDSVLFSFRSCIRIAEYYQHHKENWKELAIEELQPNPELVLIKQLQQKYPNSVNTQIKEFVAITGRSRATFFNKKRLLTPKIKTYVLHTAEKKMGDEKNVSSNRKHKG